MVEVVFILAEFDQRSCSCNFRIRCTGRSPSLTSLPHKICTFDVGSSDLLAAVSQDAMAV
jgi:hypothetical protein